VTDNLFNLNNGLLINIGQVLFSFCCFFFLCIFVTWIQIQVEKCNAARAIVWNCKIDMVCD